MRAIIFIVLTLVFPTHIFSSENNIVIEEKFCSKDLIEDSINIIREEQQNLNMSADSNIDNQYWKLSKQGKSYFMLSIPLINHSHLKKEDGFANIVGFFGIKTGYEYYLTNQYSLDFDIGAIINYPIPIPVGIDEDPADTNIKKYAASIFLDLKLGSDFKKLHTSAGLQLNNSYYITNQNRNLLDDKRESIHTSFSQLNLGAAFSGYFKLSRKFNLGVFYYPSLFSWTKNGFNIYYTHLMSFEINFIW